MAPMAPLVCAALFWGTSAITFQVQLEQSGRLMREDCHTAVAGDDCYTHVHWAMTRGITYHAKRFPSTLSASSSFEDFQAYLHTLHKLKGICAIPCVGARPEGSLEARPPAEPCRTPVRGEDCFAEVEWAMRKGFPQHPEWYPTLTSTSTFEDFQAFLHSFDNATHACGKPCEAHKDERLTEDKQEEKAAVSEEQLPVKQEEATKQSEQPAVEDVAKGEEPLLEDGDDGPNGAGSERASAPDSAAEQEEMPPGFAPVEPPQMLAPQESAPEQRMLAPIPPPAPEVPSEKGCYVWKPSGCPKQNQPADGSGWKLDVTKTHETAATTEMACMARKAQFDNYCGTTSTKMLWIPPPAPEVPSEKGCYVWKPSGCPKQNQPADGSGWKLDVTKTHEAAATSETACMARKAQFNKYCGTTSIKMIYVS